MKMPAHFLLSRSEPQLKGKARRTRTPHPVGSSNGLGAFRARGETVRVAGAPRHRAARAREVWVMESELSARAAGKLVAALLEKQSRWRG